MADTVGVTEEDMVEVMDHHLQVTTEMVITAAQDTMGMVILIVARDAN
jgi:hypothetical protein